MKINPNITSSLEQFFVENGCYVFSHSHSSIYLPSIFSTTTQLQCQDVFFNVRQSILRNILCLQHYIGSLKCSYKIRDTENNGRRCRIGSFYYLLTDEEIDHATTSRKKSPSWA